MCIGHELFRPHLAGAGVDIGAGGESGPCSSSHLGPWGRRTWETERPPFPSLSELKPKSCWTQSPLPVVTPREPHASVSGPEFEAPRHAHGSPSVFRAAGNRRAYIHQQGNGTFCQRGREHCSGVRQPGCKSGSIYLMAESPWASSLTSLCSVFSSIKWG